MSDVTIPKCNFCSNLNSSKATGWIRIFGVTIGAGRQPIQPRSWIDVCATCAPKTTIDKLPSAAVVKS
jgi:hypothetical protein